MMFVNVLLNDSSISVFVDNLVKSNITEIMYIVTTGLYTMETSKK